MYHSYHEYTGNKVSVVQFLKPPNPALTVIVLSNLKFSTRNMKLFEHQSFKNKNKLVIFVLLYLHQIVALLLLIIYQQKYVLQIHSLDVSKEHL